MGQFLDLKKKFVATGTFKVSKDGASAEIDIYGSIGEDYWGDGAVTSARDFSKELNNLPASVKQIVVRLNSPGGSVFDGIAIYERLKSSKKKVICYIDGVAASIASVIAMAADEVHIGEGAMMMVHAPWSMTVGNSKEHEKTIEILEKIENQMVGIYSRRTGLSRMEVEKWLEDDTWFTSEEAKDVGLVDTIVAASDSRLIAASMIKKAPWIKGHSEKIKIKSLDDEIKERLNNIVLSAEGFLARK